MYTPAELQDFLEWANEYAEERAEDWNAFERAMDELAPALTEEEIITLCLTRDLYELHKGLRVEH